MSNKRICETNLIDKELMFTKNEEHLPINQEIETSTEHSFNQEK